MANIEIDFITSCPVSGCPNNNCFTKLNWTHHNCGGYEKINGKGCLRCVRCNRNGPVIDWRFRCEHHDFKKASSYGLSNMLSILAQIETNNRSLVSFVNELTKSIWEMKFKSNNDYR